MDILTIYDGKTHTDPIIEGWGLTRVDPGLTLTQGLIQR